AKKPADKITKELALFGVPLLAAYLFIMFYEAGFAAFFGIPVDMISIDITHVVLTNRTTLVVAVIAFLWIGLYYNILPSTNSPFFKLMITITLVVSLALGVTFGRSDAKNQSTFLVIKTQQEQVVLRIYKDKIITAPFSRADKQVYQSFYIHNIGDHPDWLYHLEKIGPFYTK
ncbi:hypothetical protein KJ708_13280, partial [bacterium]|nr:hypothetical protein [bacterium]